MTQRNQIPEEVSDIEKYIQEKFTFQDALDDATDIDVDNPGSEEYTGNKVANTVFGQQTATDRFVQASSNFRYNIASDDFITSTTGSGNIGVFEGKGFAETDSTGGNAFIQDRRAIRYRSGREAGYLFTANFTNITDDGVGRAGIFDDDDGMILGEDVDGKYVNVRRDGVDDITRRADWDNPADNYSLGGLNVYRIVFGYLGVAPVRFEVLRDDTGWELLHEYTFGGGDDTNVINPFLHPGMEADSTNGTARVETGSWFAYTSGKGIDTQSRPFTERGDQTTVSTGTYEHVLTIRVKETYQGQTNKLDTQIVSTEYFGSSNAYVRAFAIRNANFNDALTYTDVDTENSFSEVSVTSTSLVSISNANVLDNNTLSAGGNSGGRSAADVGESALVTNPLEPSETVSIVMYTDGTPDVYAGIINWKELF